MYQYYIKIFNTKTNKLVGYYKDKGNNNISRLKFGIKYFDDLEEVKEVCNMVDDSFIRDEDGHYYTCHAVIIGEQTDKPLKKPAYQISKEERENAIQTFIRQNYFGDDA